MIKRKVLGPQPPEKPQASFLEILGIKKIVPTLLELEPN